LFGVLPGLLFGISDDAVRHLVDVFGTRS
jgi:hypothetical protein